MAPNSYHALTNDQAGRGHGGPAEAVNAICRLVCVGIVGGARRRRCGPYWRGTAVDAVTCGA